MVDLPVVKIVVGPVEHSVLFDGVPFPFPIAEGGITVGDPNPDGCPWVTVTILAETVEMIHRL